MKKWIALLLALMLCGTALAEDMAGEAPAGIVYDELAVGTLTPFTGDFFNGMWSNNTSDQDVRDLLHDYSLVEWVGETGMWQTNSMVVSGMVTLQSEEGDHVHTFVLNQDLRYSDGTPITARDYAFSMLLAASPEMQRIGASPKALDAIVGMRAYAEGKADTITGIRIVNDYQFSVTISHEVLPYFYEMGLMNFHPYPMHVIAPGCTVADQGNGAAIVNSNPAQTAPVFTAELLQRTVLDETDGYLSHPSVVSGPYRLVSYDKETGKLTFAINEQFKGNFSGVQPIIQRLTLRCVDGSEVLPALENGELGLVNKVVSGDVIREGLMNGPEDVTADNYLRSGYCFISFNCERPAMTLPVRQAIAMSIDKAALISDYVQNYGLAVDGYYGIGQWMYRMVTGGVAIPLEEPAENATAAEVAAYEKGMEAWTTLVETGLSGLTVYEQDLEAAEALLIADGWVLNEQGEAFVPGKDSVRCKQTDSGLVKLDLTLVCSEETGARRAFDACLVQPLSQIGVALHVEAVPFTALLAAYYQPGERECDMFFLASNFDEVFDPSETFACGDMMTNVNRTRIQDEELYRRAMAMRSTVPDDVLGYCERWVAFQERWTEVLPCVPLYSNVYFDFYSLLLHDYRISANITWSKAIVGAYLSDVLPGEEAEEEEFEFFE